MPLEAPRLDDRSFEDIVEEARRRIPLYCPEWTDHNLSDPGMTLVELFAWMTDIVLYRLNRVPDKHYVKFMEMIGIRLREPAPAHVPMTFWLTAPQPTDILIPALTEVATTRTESSPAIVFSTDDDFTIRVPRLEYVLTSRGSQRSGRTFQEHNVNQLAGGYEGFAAFAGNAEEGDDRPQLDDAFYLGFEDDLSNHILGIELEVARAKGEGVDPNNPPYVWEVIGSEKNQIWVRCAVDVDRTRGLNEAGLIRIHLPPMQRDTRSGYTAFWVRCRLGPAADGRGYRESPKIRRMVAASWGGTIAATNVASVRDEMMGRSDGSPGQRFYLRHTPVVARHVDEHMIVRLEDGREQYWMEVNDFASSNLDDPHYMLDSGTGEVRFGPAMPQRDGGIHCYGAIPPKNAVILLRAYRYGGGQIGNLATNTINVNKSGLPYIEKVRNRQPALGGLDAESLEDIKLRVPGYLRSLGRAVTSADFEYLGHEAAPERVGRAHCVQSPTLPGVVRLLVIPRIPQLTGFIAPESLQLADDLRDHIMGYLDERRLLCTRLEVTAPNYLWLRTEVRLRTSTLARKEDVRRNVVNKLFEFLNPLTGSFDQTGWPFGRTVLVSDVLAALLSVPGVEFIRSIKLFEITFEEGKPNLPGIERDQIIVESDEVIVSYQHDVILD